MNKVMVILSGKLGSGKDTAYGFIADELTKLGRTHRNGKFALPLKDLCANAFDPLCQLINSTVEHLVLDLRVSVGDLVAEYAYEQLKPLITKRENFYEDKTELSRLILQPVGTEVVQPIDRLHWTKILFEEFKKMPEEIMVVTDCRFPHEVNFCFDKCMESEDLTIETIRVERPNMKRDLDNAIHNHISETALDDYHFNHTLNNSSDIKHLERISRAVARHISDLV